MNLRRVRIYLTLLYGLLSLLSVGTLAVLAAQYGSDRFDATAEREARDRASDTASLISGGTIPSNEPDVWVVDPAECATPGPTPTPAPEQTPAPTPAPTPSGTTAPNCLSVGTVTPTGPSSLEPPLKELAQSALDAGSSQVQRFHQGSSDYLLYARAIPGTNQAVIAAASLDEANHDVAVLRRNIALAAVGVVILASVAGYWLAGRSLRPTRRALQQQRNFIDDAAHEMRTPLAVIQASASQALARPRSSEEYVRSLAEIRAAAERASAGVAELLDLARLDAGQASPRRAPLRLDLLLEEIISSTRVEDAEVTMQPAEPVVVDADLALLRQAIDNVVRNAARRASHVSVTVTTEANRAVVQVSDDGPGFSDDVMARAFDRFHSDTAGGVGLGLAIVSRIVALHGGSAEIANRPEGGAVVRLQLPLMSR